MLKHTPKKVIVSVDMESKDNYQFGNGQKIILQRNVSNFDLRYRNPVNAIVISAEDLPEGCEVLIEHNSTHPTNEIFDYKNDNPNIKYFSVPILECFVWRYSLEYLEKIKVAYNTANKKYKIRIRDDKKYEWEPTKHYAIAEKVYLPYRGIMVGIEPELIKNTLLIKTGEFKNKIVQTVRNSGYIIIYQDTNGKPNEILTCFHTETEDFEDERLDGKEEIVAIRDDLTEQWLNGVLLTGLYADKAKPYKKLEYAE